MPITVLSVASRALADACRRMGLDEAPLLTAAGLSREQLSDPDARIPAESADALWRHAYEASRDPLLSLHAAEALEFGAYRVLDFLAAHAPTIGAGLQSIADYFPLVDGRVLFRIDTSADPVVLSVGNNPPGHALPPPAQEYTLAALVLRTREASGVDWVPTRVDLTFPAPADDGEHRRIFRGRVRFGQPEARLLIPRAAWNVSSGGAQPALHEVLEKHARLLLDGLPDEREEAHAATRRAIAAQLSGGAPTMPVVARELGMSDKTLQRRLKDAGTSFAALVDDVRLEWAKLYLGDPGIALSEVSWLLGFSEQSAFSRAFRRWTGQSPSTFRASRSAPQT